MRRWLVPIAVCLTLSACSGFDEPASRAAIDRFHVALNAGDWPAIDLLLSRSTRELRPGAARAFRNIIARHGLYRGGELAGISLDDGRTSIAWSARYENGPVSEYFVLIEESGGLRIESYTDNPRP